MSRSSDGVDPQERARIIAEQRRAPPGAPNLDMFGHEMLAEHEERERSGRADAFRLAMAWQIAVDEVGGEHNVR